MPCQSRRRRPERSVSPSCRVPLTAALPGSRPMAPSADTDLPEPDSPTRARVSPRFTVSERRSTTVTPSKATEKSSRRSSAEREGASGIGLAPGGCGGGIGRRYRGGGVAHVAGVEGVAQPLADEDQQGEHQREADEGGDAEPGGVEVVLALGHQLPQGRRARGQAEAEEVQGG